MYHRGGDRGWHQGHHREIFHPRNHQSAPYRGGYHDHREHNNYDHDECHDRNYKDDQYMEYQEPTYHDYHEENRPYHDHREQGYHVRGRRDGGYHDGGYQKDYRGGYQQSHEESGRYYNSKSHRKKYIYRGFKPQMKESDFRMKTSMANSEQSVVHNPVHSAQSTLVRGSSQDKNLVQENVSVEGTKPEHNKKHTGDETKPDQNGAKTTKDGTKQVGTGPLKEDMKIFSEIEKISEEDIKPFNRGANAAKEGTKMDHVDTNAEMNKHSEVSVCDTKLSTTEMTPQPSFKKECIEDTKETLPVVKEETTGDEAQEETFLGRRVCSQDEDTNKTVEIPLLGDWADMPSDSIEAAGIRTNRPLEPVVNYRLSNTTQELRKAFILAKKEEIELAFSQDCRTFAFVANTLLKKDPSLEVAVSNALRSTLQDIAGRCVQELSKFIDHYDNIPVNISERLQNSDI